MIHLYRVHNHKRAFTLLETIIYIALLSVILTGLMVAVYPLFTGAERNTAKVNAEGEAAFILRKVAWALSSAASVSEPAAGSSGDTLTIVGGVSLAENDGAIEVDGVPITNSRVEVSDFSVTHTAPSGNTPRLIEVSFKIDGTPVGPWQKYVHF